MLKKVIEDPRKKAILVLPYVALVQEKSKWLRRAVEGVCKNVALLDDTPDRYRRSRHDHTSVRVVAFFGGSKARAAWADVDIAVCTIEKANALVNTAIEDCTINHLGIVVLDELHMIDDDHRGYLMELMATKLLSLQQGVQIIGMSATLSNTEILAKWLDAKHYQSKYRPVPVEEYLVYDHSIYPASTSSAYFKTASQLNATQPKCLVNPTRTIQPSAYSELKKPMTNAVISLALETVEAGYAALVFCSGRQGCQATALMISEAMPCREGFADDILHRRKEVLSNLRSLSVGLDDTLEKTIIQGVAFHHAGLTTEERDIVAEAYDRGTIKVIVATCSLAAGINLPARRVILQGARMGRDLIGPAMLRQMRGRAGRKGKDEIGESYLCCEKKDLEEVAQLLEADLPAVESCLTPQKRGINRALLEVLAIRLATHANAIDDYMSRTLLSHTMDRGILNEMVEKTIQELIDINLVTVNSTGSYEATLLGQAIVFSSLTPEDGIFVHEELQRALRAFVMDGEMHIFYIFTPVQPAGLVDISWPIFRREMDGLDESGLRVLNFVGINPGFVNRMANSSRTLPERTLEEINTARVYRRFYAAFHLRDLCNELPIHAVARKYETPRGFVQNLAQTCEGFAAGMVKFCDRMGMGMLRSVLEHMIDRLKAGAKADLLELAKIPFVKSRTARVFWENGMRSLRAVAEASPTDIVAILLLAQPKKSKISGEEEEKYRQKLMLKAEIIVSAASRLWERQQQIEIEDEI
ncbi:dna-directed dna polymerase [Lasallia pustulata]|uniref:Dna-directed dna polymerase n=1 Tax=Lasallia pustulata TaxID=136370 RepID=A0A1W5DAH6_9LECA|nr:dna-directed dna polymerase [Lasallia pustulata]